MKITDRIKKLKKLVGSSIKYSYSDEFFTPNSNSSKIIGFQIESLYDISLIVKCEGVINPLNTLKKYNAFKIIKLPLIKSYMGKYVFPVYNCIDQSVKTIFVTKNDIDSSLLKNSDYSLIDELEEAKKRLKLNISVKRNFVCDDEDKVMCKIFKLSKQECEMLKAIGLTPYGWRNTLAETHIFDPNFFNLDTIYQINSDVEKLEEIEVYQGLLKITKTRTQNL